MNSFSNILITAEFILYKYDNLSYISTILQIVKDKKEKSTPLDSTPFCNLIKKQRLRDRLYSGIMSNVKIVNNYF